MLVMREAENGGTFAENGGTFAETILESKMFFSAHLPCFISCLVLFL